MLEQLCHKIQKIGFFTRGKRGFLFKGIYKGKIVIIKTKNPQSKAVGRILNEANYLKILNKYKIGPKLLFYTEDYLVYEFIDGVFFGECVEKEKNKAKIIKIIKGIFEQLYALDKLKINKEEMHHPVKHIIVDKNGSPWLLDFERAYRTEKPKNVTQFVQYLSSNRMIELLNEKGINIEKEKAINSAKEYKKNMNKKNLEKIIGLFC